MRPLKAWAYDDKKILYIPVPKVASNSIKAYLGNLDRKVKLNLVYRFKNYFKFAFVRNPYDRFASFYYDKIKSWNAIGRNKFFLVKNGISSKTTLVEAAEKICKYYRSNIHTVPQVDFLFNDKMIMVDFVGKFENINEDIDIIKSHFKSTTNLLHLNASKKPQVYQYDSVYKDIIYNTYKEDFKLLGYHK